MYYEINVSLNGKHLFATAERSLTTEDKARELFRDFATRFPAEQGYAVSCTRYETVGREVSWSCPTASPTAMCGHGKPTRICRHCG